MASESLSQQEIDLLFGGSAATRPAPVPRAQRIDVQVYDFRRPNRISKDRMRALEAMYGLLAKSLESWLTSRVREQVEIMLLGVEQFSFGEFLLSLPTPCNSYVFDIADSGGQQGVIDFGREFAYFVVDRFLGGNGVPAVLDRALSPLERMIVRLVADRVQTLLSEAWQDHVRLELTLNRFESIPDMLQIANREDPVLVANMEVLAGGHRSSLLLCLPFAVLEKFFTSSGFSRVRVVPGTARDRAADREAIEETLRSTHVSVSVRLPAVRLSMRDLSSLRPGGVLLTGLAPDTEAEVLVSGKPRFRGVAGRVGRKVAVRITAVEEADRPGANGEN